MAGDASAAHDHDSYDQIEEQFQDALDEGLGPAGPGVLYDLAAGLGRRRNHGRGPLAVDLDLGYLGRLTGPAAIGWMTRLVALNYTFLFPALLPVIAAATAGILRSGTGPSPSPGPSPKWRSAPDLL